jgi:hypothetical protein
MKTTYHEEEGKIILNYQEDLEALLKANHEQRQARSRLDKKADLHHVMRVPQVILMKIMQETGLDFFKPEDAKLILEILKGPEYAAFRTYPGQI